MSPGLEKLLRPKDLFALLIAAIGHDAAHPGVNNMFLASNASRGKDVHKLTCHAMHR